MVGVVCVCVCHDPCAETGFGTGRSRSLCSTESARVHERMRKCRASVCNHVCKCLCVSCADAHNHSALAARRTHARVGRGIRLRMSVCASAEQVCATMCASACVCRAQTRTITVPWLRRRAQSQCLSCATHTCSRWTWYPPSHERACVCEC